MAGKTEYKNNWQKENKERINLVVDKGYKDKVRTGAEKAGLSLNGFIIAAVNEKIEREKEAKSKI